MMYDFSLGFSALGVEANSIQSIQVCIGDIIVQKPTAPTSHVTTAPTTMPTHTMPTTSKPLVPTPPTSSKKPPTSSSASPPIASVVQQANQCGNNVGVYCCNNDALHGGDANCSAMGKLVMYLLGWFLADFTVLGQSSICDTTIVCCNAHNVCFLSCSNSWKLILTPDNRASKFASATLSSRTNRLPTLRPSR